MGYRFDTVTSDFTCKHCHHYVSTDPILSGVNNRNHCPYCLWSRHMDLYRPGDRLSACKGPMEPVGVTLKRTNKKYGSRQGELMLIHCCAECGSLSINRLAADDDTEKVYALFENGLRLDIKDKATLRHAGIQLLGVEDRDIVCARLFGWHESAPLTPALSSIV